MTSVLALDPLRRLKDGRYDDHRVLVTYGGPRGLSATRSADGRVVVHHRLRRVDDDLAELLATALHPITDDHDVFARCFVGVVLTCHDDPVVAWEQFYRASLARIDDRSRGGYVEIYRHALTLLPRTSVLDAGASFGFLALHLAALGVDVRACETDPGTAGLLTVMSARLGHPLEVSTDLAGVPDRSVDAVALLHVLEHVDEAEASALLAESMRIARKRVVVAVPYEEVPGSLFGHVRTMCADDLDRIGKYTNWVYEVDHHSGGWLVLDRPPVHAAIARPGDRTAGKGDQQ